jgi:hypothetical protein
VAAGTDKSLPQQKSLISLHLIKIFFQSHSTKLISRSISQNPMARTKL